jgi:hypothetical protein
LFGLYSQIIDMHLAAKSTRSNPTGIKK